MSKPSINISQAPSGGPPRTPRTGSRDRSAGDGTGDHVNDTDDADSVNGKDIVTEYGKGTGVPSHSSYLNSITKTNLTPTISFGLGFLPSFPFNSPRNLNILNSLSPQRFFQTSNSLNRAVSAKKSDSGVGTGAGAGAGVGAGAGAGATTTTTTGDKNVFTPITPSKINSRFLDSLSSSLTKSKSDSDSSINDSGDLWSSANDSNNLSNLTSIYEDSPANAAKPASHMTKPNNDEFLTPNRIFAKPSSSKMDFTNPSKKRRVSIQDSPSSSIASKIETIASPPRGSRSSVSSLPMDSTDKIWNKQLDDALMSSYLKYKTFKTNNDSQSTVLKNVSENKVISRMLLNKTGVLRNPKQVASRLYKLTKMTLRKESTDLSPSVANEIEELIKTPLDNLIGTNLLDSINTTEINEQIDKELDLIFSPENNFNHSSESIPNITIDDFILNYEKSHSKVHHFTKLGCKLNSSIELTSSSLIKVLQLDSSSLLTKNIIQKFESKNLEVFQLSNHLNVNMKQSNSFISLDSVISSANPLDLENGSVNAFMKLLVSNDNDKDSVLNWNCNSKIFNDNELLLELNQPIDGYYNGSNDKFEVTVPFLKNFWNGFLSLLVNGGDNENLISKISIVQIIHDGKYFDENSQVKGCFVHKFSKGNSNGSTDYQTINYVPIDNEDKNVDDVEGVEGDGLNDDGLNDDNETVLADSSPIRNFEITPRRPMKLDLSSTKRPSITPGPATAPLFNSKDIYQANRQNGLNSYNPFHSQSYSNIPTINSQQQQQQQQPNSDTKSPLIHKNGPNPIPTPDMVSPFHPMTGGFVPEINSMATSTPAKFFGDSRPQQMTQLPQQPQFPMGQTFQQKYIQQPQFPQMMDHQQVMLLQQQIPNQVPQMGLQYPQSNMNQIPNVNPFSQPQPFSQPMDDQFLNQAMMQQRQPFQPLTMNNQQNQFYTNQMPNSTANPNPNPKKSKDKSVQIKFGPMLEYDPSKNRKASTGKLSQKPAAGLYRFPVNTPVSMYKPPKS